MIRTWARGRLLEMTAPLIPPPGRREQDGSRRWWTGTSDRRRGRPSGKIVKREIVPPAEMGERRGYG